ncbi:MAG: DUF6089 family protein [Cyclobacteriaceae bacterium]
MRYKAFISFSLILFILATAFDADAQRRRRNRYKKKKYNNKSVSRYKGRSIGGRFRAYNYVDFSVNALNYYGDLAPVNKAASTDVSFTRPGFGVNVGHKFNPYSAIRMGFNWGRIVGADISSYESGETPQKWQPRYARGLSFRNDIKELSLGFEFQFIPNYGGPTSRQILNGYLFVGGAIIHHEPKGLVPEFDYQTGGTAPVPQAGEWVKLRKLGTEGQKLDDPQGDVYLPISFTIPIALGLKLRLPGPFSAAVELGYRFSFTDYLDDVSTNYVALDRFENELTRIMSDRSAEPIHARTGEERDLAIGQLSTVTQSGTQYTTASLVGAGYEGSIRGNPDNNDMFFITSLKLRMILTGRTRSTAKFR